MAIFELNSPEQEHRRVPKVPSVNPNKDPINDRPETENPNEKAFPDSWLFPIDFVDNETAFHGGPKKRTGLKLALWTWLSASIDGLVLFSLSCFFMVFFSFLMKTSAKSFLSLVFNNRTGVEAFILLFIITGWSYLIFSRVFMGASIGEKSCDLRLGQPLQRFQADYILKVIFRSTLIIVTGIFVLPLLSAFFRRDLAGDLSGVKIYSLQ